MLSDARLLCWAVQTCFLQEQSLVGIKEHRMMWAKVARFALEEERSGEPETDRSDRDVLAVLAGLKPNGSSAQSVVLSALGRGAFVSFSLQTSWKRPWDRCKACLVLFGDYYH